MIPKRAIILSLLIKNSSNKQVICRKLHSLDTKLKTIEESTVEGKNTRVRVLSKQDKDISNPWISTIGLEVHAQIATNTKLFSTAKAKDASRAPANSNVTFLDASIPGTLPVLNRSCVEAGIKTALALNCKINSFSTFDRKHYFYADLPAGYQITQQRNPLATGGALQFMVLSSEAEHKQKGYYEGSAGIVQLQLEQDSGKSLHDEEGRKSLIDLNRCGVGLMEIVFQPDLFNGEEAASLVRELSLILKCIGSSTCRMEEGALRVDANISVRQPGQPLGIRTEVKNLNSLRSVTLAIEYEVQRQIQALEEGGVIENETRSFDTMYNETVPMRDKEVKQDYRFMPEPNLPPLRFVDQIESSKHYNILNVNEYREKLPEMPSTTRIILMDKYGLAADYSLRLLEDEILHRYFDEIIKTLTETPDSDKNLIKYARMACQILFCDIENICSKWPSLALNEIYIKPQHVAEAAKMRSNRDLSSNLIKQGLELIMEEEKYRNSCLSDIVAEQGWLDSFRDKERIQIMVSDAIKDHKKLVGKYIRGNTKGFETIVRSIFKKNGTDIDPSFVRQELKDQLEYLKQQEKNM